MAIAIAFGLAWLAVFIAAADHPPPFGFIGLLPVLALSSALVYWRASIYASWRAQSRPGCTCRAILEGALGGVAFAVLVGLLPGIGEPSIRPTVASVVVLLGVSSAFGSLSSIVVYLLSGGHESGTPPSGRSGEA